MTMTYSSNRRISHLIGDLEFSVGGRGWYSMVAWTLYFANFPGASWNRQNFGRKGCGVPQICHYQVSNSCICLPFKKMMLLRSDVEIVPFPEEAETSPNKVQFPGGVPLYWQTWHSAALEHLNDKHLYNKSTLNKFQNVLTLQFRISIRTICWNYQEFSMGI